MKRIYHQIKIRVSQPDTPTADPYNEEQLKTYCKFFTPPHCRIEEIEIVKETLHNKGGE